MAALTIAYVLLAFMQDQGSGGPVTAGVVVLATVFVVEFSTRLYDSPSRLVYLKRHWLDIVTCIPVVGSLRGLAPCPAAGLSETWGGCARFWCRRHCE